MATDVKNQAHERSDDKQLQIRIARLDGLVQEIDTFSDPVARAKTREIVETLLELQGVALTAVLDEVGASQGGDALVRALARNDLVSGLLVLHGLHPSPLADRVEQALERTRPLLKSHGGNVELLDVLPDGSVRLRLNGSCHGCPSSQATLKSTIEEAIYAAAPDVTTIEVEGAVEASPPPSGGFVPLAQFVAPLSAAAPPSTPILSEQRLGEREMSQQQPPVPKHIQGTAKGEEMVCKHGREPGRQTNGRGYRSGRDSSSVSPQDPIDPQSPQMPPA